MGCVLGNNKYALSKDDMSQNSFMSTQFAKIKGRKLCCECVNGQPDSKGSVSEIKSGQHKKRHLCHKCALSYSINKQLQRQNSGKTSTTSNSLTDLLALTALDLTAPASDALLKNRKNAWIQLAGHPGTFAPAGPNTIWKRLITKDNMETKAYETLMKDTAHDCVPIFYREVTHNGEHFIEMEDLLQRFTNPNIMDIKIGKRTFLESEVKNPALRKDLYEKMVALDPDAPTEEEKECKAIRKLRYMQFRERESSSSEYGFRIEAIRQAGQPPETNLKKVKTKEQISLQLSKFLCRNEEARDMICERLKYIRKKFESSTFFMSHELIGSSALVIFDEEGHAGVWMIDFSKAVPAEGHLTLTHRKSWVLGNHEDGYLTGLDNLIEIFDELDLTKYHSNTTINNSQGDG